MNKSIQLVAFCLDEQRYAFYLSAVERVVCMVEITPLPKAPAVVLGIINMQGRIIPVVNIRKRFRLPEREIGLSDHLIIANTSRRTVALVADEVSGVFERPGEEVIATEKILPGMEYVEGVVKLEDGMILIHNLELFLSLQEEEALSEGMEELKQNERKD